MWSFSWLIVTRADNRTYGHEVLPSGHCRPRLLWAQQDKLRCAQSLKKCEHLLGLAIFPDDIAPQIHEFR